MLLLCIIWEDWLIFMISASNEQLQQQLKYTQLKPGCHSWWISKMQWGHLQEWYAIKLCFKLESNVTGTCGKLQTAFWTILHESSISFIFGIGYSRKAESLWGMMRGVGGVRKSINQSWLAKGLRLGLLCWGFKGVQEEIPWKGPALFKSFSVAFPPRQYTSPQHHPCHRLFDHDGHQDSFSASL